MSAPANTPAQAADLAAPDLAPRRPRLRNGRNASPSVREGSSPTTAASDGAGLWTLALTSLAEVEFRMGDWRAAHASAVEALGLACSGDRGDETRQALASLALIEAGLGREQACHSHAERALAMAASAADDPSADRARAALGLLELGLGHFDATVAWLEPLACGATRVADTCDADLTEALFRRGDRARAANTLALAEARARTPWSQRALERCRGLLAADDEFEAHFVRALDRFASLADPFGRARIELCFGQRLRRVGRRVAARGRLRSALETFECLGAARWIDAALHELRASGERAQRRSGATADGLTARELQVSLEVAEGATNHEAAAALFVTVKTIEAHLRSIYRKLGIRSRAELTRLVLSGQEMLGSTQRRPAAGQSSGFSSMRGAEGRARVAVWAN